MNTDVKIGDYVYKGCKMIEINLETDITSTPIEAGNYVDYHAYNKPTTFSLDITFFNDLKVVGAQRLNYEGQNMAATIAMGSMSLPSSSGNSNRQTGVPPWNRAEQYAYLKWLRDNKMVFKLVSDLGCFENMMITSLSVKETFESKSSFIATLGVKQLIVVDFAASVFQWITDGDTIIGVTPVGLYNVVTLVEPAEDGPGPDWWTLNVAKPVSDALHSLWKTLAGYD